MCRWREASKAKAAGRGTELGTPHNQSCPYDVVVRQWGPRGRSEPPGWVGTSHYRESSGCQPGTDSQTCEWGCPQRTRIGNMLEILKRRFYPCEKANMVPKLYPEELQGLQRHLGSLWRWRGEKVERVLSLPLSISQYNTILISLIYWESM